MPVVDQQNVGRRPDDPTSIELKTKESILFVDLDGSLLKTDLLGEGFLLAMRQPISNGWRILLSAPRGRAAVKRAIAELVVPAPQRLPYRQEVVQLIERKRENGTIVVLATASDDIWAKAIAAELGLFDGILASNGTENLKGRFKLAAIEECCREREMPTFDYLGDSTSDLVIWQKARRAYVVAQPSGRLVKRIDPSDTDIRLISSPAKRLSHVLSALRPKHWVKNLLVLVPLILSHQVFNLTLLVSAIIAVAAFCLCSSAVYCLNDLFDLEFDRIHPKKKFRPFAAGQISAISGISIAAALLTGSALLSISFLPPLFNACLALYFIMTTLYSFSLKRVALVDVFTLAGLFTLRMLAGGAATNIPVSEWLVAFSMFLFLSLAYLKRYAELRRLATSDRGTAEGRGYFVDDMNLVEIVGLISGYLSILVFSLYINSDAMKILYLHSWPLWLMSPVLLYWVTHLWLEARRNESLEDPILFALSDRKSWIVAGIVALLFVLASFPMKII